MLPPTQVDACCAGAVLISDDLLGIVGPPFSIPLIFSHTFTQTHTRTFRFSPQIYRVANNTVFPSTQPTSPITPFPSPAASSGDNTFVVSNTGSSSVHKYTLLAPLFSLNLFFSAVLISAGCTLLALVLVLCLSWYIRRRRLSRKWKGDVDTSGSLELQQEGERSALRLSTRLELA